MGITYFVQRYIPLHLFFLLCCSSPATADITLTETLSAESFTIQSSKKFYIHGDDEIIGIVHKKSHAKSYEFIDSEKNLCSVAALDKENPELGSKFDVHDAEGGYLGSIIESPFSFLPEYSFESPSGKLLAIANANFFHTEYILIDPETGDTIASLHRPAFRECNDWSATILLPEHFELDPCVFISFLVIRSDN